MSKPHTLDHVLSLIALPWAMEPTVLAFAWSVVEQRLINGPRVEPLDVKAFDLGRDAEDDDAEEAPPGVAILPVHGVLAPRINLLAGLSGGTTFQGIERDLGKALAAPQVKTIVLDINSPGGSVFGARSCARAILAARAHKPVVAHIHPQGNSAAYWLAACATEVVAECSAMVGSVGVYLAHDNIVGMLTNAGIERTLIAFGDCKLDGHPSQPLNERAKARLQALCDLNGNHFVADVAAGRGRSVAQVLDRFGQGDSLPAEEALERGLIDRIAPRDATLARFAAHALLPRAIAAAPPVHPTASVEPSDTPQEPSPATGQDRAAQHALARAVLDLAF